MVAILAMLISALMGDGGKALPERVNRVGFANSFTEGNFTHMPMLHWLTKEDDVKAAQNVPYRLLEEVPELGVGDLNAGNMLIQGDNLEALKALLPFYAGKVKCIYIDPPYNTKSAFEHYDDNLEHSQWLAMI